MVCSIIEECLVFSINQCHLVNLSDVCGDVSCTRATPSAGHHPYGDGHFSPEFLAHCFGECGCMV